MTAGFLSLPNDTTDSSSTPPELSRIVSPGMPSDAYETEEEYEESKPTASTRRAQAAGLPGLSAAASLAVGTSSLSPRVVQSISRPQAAFVYKLFSMVQDPSLSSLISWGEGGRVFAVFNPVEFAKDVLPMFFKHQNFQSFVRQLNMYSFHKVTDQFSNTSSEPSTSDTPVAGSSWEFAHEFFQRDRPELLENIKRKSSKTTSTISSTPRPRKTSRSRSRSPSPSRDDSSQSSTPPSDRGPINSAAPSIRHAVHPNSPPNSGPAPRASSGWNDWARDAPKGRPVLHLPTPCEGSFHDLFPPPIHHRERSPSASRDDLPRRSHSAEDLAAQVAQLSAHVEALTDALHQNRHQVAAERASASSIMWMVLDAVASVDGSGRRGQELELAYAALARRDPSGRHRAAPPPSARHLSAAPSSRDHPGSRPTSAPAHSSMSYSYSPPNPTWSRAPNPAESYARGSSDASSHGGRSPQVEYPRPRSSSDRMAPGTQLPPLASLFGGSPEWAGDEDGSGRKRLRRF